MDPVEYKVRHSTGQESWDDAEIEFRSQIKTKYECKNRVKVAH